ncbi:PD40 domain-containing protein [Clostridium thermarum]|uniref:PD40 domain-containing protein n=1 Tax=Clostridium thermarum TaxID=1716543 RepID=UPI0013D670E6|nr:PD40 domain-containing protein [Clostridium thermarum]
MKMVKVSFLRVISLFTTMILSSACSSQEVTEVKQTKEVLQNIAVEREKTIILKNIHTIQGIYPLDWFDEEYILIKKENINKPEIDKGDSTKGYSNNLYKYNIKTGKEELLVASTRDIGYAVLSPDRRYVYYQEDADVTATGYIYDIENNKNIRVTDMEEIPAGIGRWVDNKIIFYSAAKGAVFTADVAGCRKQIIPANGMFMRDPIKVRDNVYFVSSEYKLYKYDIRSNKLTNLLSDAAEFVPNKDGSKFAFVPLGRKSLDIRDTKGNKIMNIYDQGSVGGFSWSKDGKRLAYVVMPQDSSKERLFITYVDTGKTIQFPLDLPQSFPNILWNPSENKLLMTGYEIVDNINKAFAVIIELE